MFSEIIGKYCRGVRRRDSLDGFLKGEFFPKCLEIIGKYYCQGARRRISSDRFFKGDFFFGNFRKLLENIVGVRDDESQLTGS
jgi:hypothetical protein